MTRTEITGRCEECGSRQDVLDEPLYCKKCYDSLEEQITDLRDEVRRLQEENDELQRQIDETENKCQ
jgi:uncharacterized protein YlxW (UPF0749 family)